MEVKKAKWLKFISAIAIFAVMIFCTGLNVHAEDVKDGILVTVSSDKENYNSEDEVNLKITVKNTNDFEVSDIKVENILPDGVSLLSGDISKDNINLQANEENTMNLTVKKADSGQADTTGNTTNNSGATEKNTTVSKSAKHLNTGDNNSALIALIVMLVSIVVMIVCFLLKDRKKYSKFLSVLICLGVINTLGITYASLDKTQAETTNSSEENKSSFTTEFTYIIDDVNYTHNVKITYYDIDFYIFNAVDKEIYETVVSDNFKNASLDERKEIALNVLNKLENENKILKGSITLNKEHNIYFFEYINGGESSIILDGFSSSETNNDNYNMSDEVDLLNLDRIYNFENYVKSVSNKTVNETYISSGHINANRYIKDNLSVCNLTYYPKTALIIDCINENYERDINNKLVQTWTSNDLKTDIKSNVTVEEFKTILNGYNFINIDTHGNIDSKGNPIVFLQEEKKSLLDNKYYQDIKAGRIGTANGLWGGSFYLKSDFFSYYYSDKLIDKIIWLSCCKGYANDTLVKALANDCKAKSVIGYTDTVNGYYEGLMRDYVIHKLLFGHTIDEALKEAKSVYGNNDAQWYLKKYNKKDNTPAECKNYNGGNETLVELVRINNNGTLSGIVTDEDNNPIKDAEIIINNVRGMSYGITTTTNENGEYTLECPQDSYKIGVKADGYETFETDDFVNINYGEETIFNITLKKEIITPTVNHTAVDLIDKTIPEIISLMNGEYQIIKTENDLYIYIQNQSVLSGMEFYVKVSGDDIVSANNGEEIHNDTLRAKLEAGELTLDGIQVNNSGKVSETIQANMDYKSCSKVLGDFNCIGGTGGYLGGDVSSISYDYNDNNAKVILKFNIPEEIYKDLSLGKISSVSSEQMEFYNPKLKNVVIRKSEANTKPTNLTVNVDSTYIGEITKDNCTHYYKMNINEDNSLFTVQCTNSNSVKGGFDLPIDKLENGVYFYTNGSCYDRNQITGGRINVFNNLTGTITVNDDGSLLWKTENSLPYELILNPNNMYSKEVLFTGTVNTEKDPLNVRKSPSMEAEIIGRIDKGSTVTVYSETDGWCEIEYNGGIGYVSKYYIKVNGDTENQQTNSISDNEILKAVNKYLEENQSNLGVWLSDGNPYCPSGYMASNDTNWSCPINTDWDNYSSNEIAGAYPHFAYVDKSTLKCTLTANYETVIEFDLSDYIQ